MQNDVAPHVHAARPSSTPTARTDNGRLKDRADRVRLLCSSLPMRSTRRSQYLHRELSVLKRLLSEHFDFEESDGYLTELIARRPSLLPEARRLLQEHRELLHAVNTALDSSPLDFDAMATASLAAVEQFERHERAENLLLQRAYCDDLGDGG